MIKFKINNRVWGMDFFDPNGYSEEDGVPLGITKYADQLILLSNSLQEDCLYNTIKHELTHAFRWSFGFVVDTQNTSMTVAEVEEIVANFIECFGQQVLNLSEVLFKKLLEEKNGERV